MAKLTLSLLLTLSCIVTGLQAGGIQTGEVDLYAPNWTHLEFQPDSEMPYLTHTYGMELPVAQGKSLWYWPMYFNGTAKEEVFTVKMLKEKAGVEWPADEVAADKLAAEATAAVTVSLTEMAAARF